MPKYCINCGKEMSAKECKQSGKYCNEHYFRNYEKYKQQAIKRHNPRAHFVPFKPNRVSQSYVTGLFGYA